MSDIHGGDVLWNCNYGLFSCLSLEACLESNFSMPSYSYILRGYQAEYLGLLNSVTINPQTMTYPGPTSFSAALPGATTSAGANDAKGSQPLETLCAGVIEAQQSDDTKKMAAVGAGVGIPLGILFLAFLALYVLEKRKTNRMETERTTSDQRPAAGFNESRSSYQQDSWNKQDQVHQLMDLEEYNAGNELSGNEAAAPFELVGNARR